MIKFFYTNWNNTCTALLNEGDSLRINLPLARVPLVVRRLIYISLLTPLSSIYG